VIKRKLIPIMIPFISRYNEYSNHYSTVFQKQQLDRKEKQNKTKNKDWKISPFLRKAEGN